MADTQGMASHHAEITVNAPVHQVYGLFSHFNDFPKFMSFVKEVTYYDDERSHWVAEVVGRHEWDAVNDSWVQNQQIGWHSTDGLENFGRVTFQPTGANQTQVDVYINYNPPAGVFGDIGEKLGGGSRFDDVLQHDLDNFARMVDQAPPGSLDPTSSNYLFHSGSAAAKGTTTSRQDETMNRDRDHMRSSSNTDYTNMAMNTSGYNDPTMTDNEQSSGTSGGYTNAMPNPMQNPNSMSYDTNPSATYTDTTTNPTNQGYGTNTDYNDSASQGYGTNTGYSDPTITPNNPTYGTHPGTGNTDQSKTPNRPILDQDIINENTGTTPNYSGTQDDLLPPDSGTANPVWPPDENTTDR